MEWERQAERAPQSVTNAQNWKEKGQTELDFTGSPKVRFWKAAEEKAHCLHNSSQLAGNHSGFKTNLFFFFAKVIHVLSGSTENIDRYRGGKNSSNSPKSSTRKNCCSYIDI